MQQAQPIVIVDRNGTEHEFPAGFDPKKAAEIVRTQLDAGQPVQPPQQAEQPKQSGAFATIGDLFVGAGKGIARTAGDVMGGMATMFPGVNYTPADDAKVEQDTSPTNTAQKVGFVAEKALEFGVPGAKLAQAGIRAIPNAARAGRNFQDVMGAAKNVAVDVSKPGDVALRIMQLAERGASMPKAVRDFLKRVTDPEKGAMTYEEARDFASNISRLSANEYKRLSPVVGKEIHNLRVTLNKAVEAAAMKAGKGEEYARAMAEYRRAARLREAADKTKSAVVKYGLPAGAATWVGSQIINKD